MQLYHGMHMLIPQTVREYCDIQYTIAIKMSRRAAAPSPPIEPSARRKYSMPTPCGASPSCSGSQIEEWVVEDWRGVESIVAPRQLRAGSFI